MRNLPGKLKCVAELFVGEPVVKPVQPLVDILAEITGQSTG